MSARPRPAVAPEGQGSEGILQAIKGRSRHLKGFRCPKCGFKTGDEAEFEKHLGDHLQTWQQDLARCFERG